jgi:hypothetical protein
VIFNEKNLQSAYLSAPSLDLKTALSCVPDLIFAESAVDVVYKNSKPTFELTKEEVAAVTIYTSNEIYQTVNRALRTEELANIQPWFAYLKLFHTAINKLSPQKHTFCRGESNNWIDSYGIGSILTLVN